MAKRKRQHKKASRQEIIYQIALSGISASIALLFVYLGGVVRFSTVAFFIAASLAVMVPLAKKYYFASFFAYAVSAALGFVIAGDIIAVVGYIAYFGPMALITGIMYNCKVKQFIALPVKIVYINGALALMYFACHTIMISDEIMGKIDYWVVALVGTVILVLVDYALQFVYSRIVPLLDKILRPKDKKEQKPTLNDDEEELTSDDGISPFDEFADENKVSHSAENYNADSAAEVKGGESGNDGVKENPSEEKPDGTDPDGNQDNK